MHKTILKTNNFRKEGKKKGRKPCYTPAPSTVRTADQQHPQPVGTHQIYKASATPQTCWIWPVVYQGSRESLLQACKQPCKVRAASQRINRIQGSESKVTWLVGRTARMSVTSAQAPTPQTLLKAQRITVPMDAWVWGSSDQLSISHSQCQLPPKSNLVKTSMIDEEIQTVNKHVGKCSLYLVIRHANESNI